MSRDIGAVPFEDVKRFTAAWMADVGHDELVTASNGLSHRLGLVDQGGHGRPGYGRERFKGQVKRALDQLTEEGQLVKVAQGDFTPSGTSPVDRPVWYTRERYEAEDSARKLRASRAAEYAQRWEKVHAALTLAGYDPLTETTGPAMLSLEGWEALIDSNGLPAINAQGENESLLRYRKRTRAAEVAKDLASALQADDMEQVRRLLAEVTAEVDEVRAHDARAHI